ncbi:hypothetical protein H6G74_22765 [Nostoc spongiaeforme FACHB-130]|uniref:Tetratricopeptide repeat protein n=1 Tax=Nostoc spongiaeforme FACHB-130 TaxID=1357510 RepID=A0ABR8G1L3_9NOSO|nr:hypothetical protein [Nostoc spongiaeforme]MBD2597125.1 hypothetical protein [Nostoc spongiaeforme FACHB-130]
MAQQSQNSLQHFNLLKSKYQVTQDPDSLPPNILYFILRKADLGVELSASEMNCLKESQLEQTLKTIKQEQQHRLQESINIENEFSQLKSKYKAKKHDTYWQLSPLYYLLLKLESGQYLTNSECHWLKSNHLDDTNSLAQEIKLFIQLKSKYKANSYQNSFPTSKLYSILKKLNISESLTQAEYDWLINNQLWETAEIFKQQESAKEAEFAALKVKYQATKYQTQSLCPRLYNILLKIEAQQQLSDDDLKWLEQQQLTETIAIFQEIEQTKEFIALKIKYHAAQYQDSSPKSHLYKILKSLEARNKLGEQDINFLKKRKLTDTIKIANEQYVSRLKSKIDLGELLDNSEIDWLKDNGREDIIILAKQKHYNYLKKKYRFVDFNPSIEPFYTIMVKLENKERLDIILVIQLIEQEQLSSSGGIATAHYKLEAEFYEQEYSRTGNKWSIPTASSYWRKANEAEQSLKLTNLDLNKIKENKLKSAILVTRGAAFRDLGKLGEAEKCAVKAMEFHPASYQPYTLMGAIYYDLGDYIKGDYYFDEAIKRGAKTEEIDYEIKRIFRNKKDEEQRHEAAIYLLKKDSHRYAWAKTYLKTPKNHE